jgi:hypothetical protein
MNQNTSGPLARPEVLSPIESHERNFGKTIVAIEGRTQSGIATGRASPARRLRTLPTSDSDHPAVGVRVSWYGN